MEYVFSGEDLANVLRENSIRIARGTLKVRPLEDEVAEEGKEVIPADDKAVVPTDNKKPAKKAKK